MQNGKKISEIIQNMQALQDNWETVIAEEKEDRSEEMDEQRNRLFNILRQELKRSGEEEVYEFLLAEGMQKETAHKLIKKAVWMLQFYNSFRLLRELESNDGMILKGLLSSIYQKNIVRFEYDGLKQMTYMGYDEEEVIDIAERMDYLTDYYVSRSFTRKEMVRDLRDETGLLTENCEYWADLIEENYLALKMNYIIEELGRIREELADLIK